MQVGIPWRSTKHEDNQLSSWPQQQYGRATEAHVELDEEQSDDSAVPSNGDSNGQVSQCIEQDSLDDIVSPYNNNSESISNQ